MASEFAKQCVLQCLPGTGQEIAERTGYHQVYVNEIARKLASEGRIGILEYVRPSGHGPYVPVYSDDPKDAAKRPRAVPKKIACQKWRLRNRKPKPDPLVAAFFGRKP